MPKHGKTMPLAEFLGNSGGEEPARYSGGYQNSNWSLPPDWKELGDLVALRYGADAVWRFRGENFVFSNMYSLLEEHGVQVTLDGQKYPSTEHAYMAAKTCDPD